MLEVSLSIFLGIYVRNVGNRLVFGFREVGYVGLLTGRVVSVRLLEVQKSWQTPSSMPWYDWYLIRYSEQVDRT